MSWKCGTSPITARQHLEVARRLPVLPKLRERFATGTMSYSKVRALCRHATPDNEEALIVVADSSTAAMLERILAAIEQVIAAGSADLADRGHRRRGVHIGRARPDRTVPIRIDASAELAAALRARLDDYGPGIPDECVNGADHPAAARRHDALHRLIEGPEPAQLVVNLHADLADLDTIRRNDPSAHAERTENDSAESPDPSLTQTEDLFWSNERFGPAVHAAGKLLTPAPISEPMAQLLRRIGCDARIRFVIDDHGATIDLGRTSRDPNRRLRRYILQRDQYQCRCPGCHHPGEHIHHITAWIDGGPTNRDNLVAVCRYHHHLLHHQGFSLTGNPEQVHGLELHSSERGPISGEQPTPLRQSTINPNRFVRDPTRHAVGTRHYHGPMDLHHAVSTLIQLIPQPDEMAHAA